MDFSPFGQAVTQQFKKMAEHGLFRVQIEKDMLWHNYLGAFPEGSNPMFRKRTEHDCSACRNFIRTVGGVVSIIDGQLVSIWDIQIDGPYQVVADSMSELVKVCKIDNVFLHTEPRVGIARNHEEVPTADGKPGTIIAWEHFAVELPPECVVKGIEIGPKLSEWRGTKDVMKRSLEEITGDAIDTVLDLVAQNSLPRGHEQKFALEHFRKDKTEFDKLGTDLARELYCWHWFKTIPASVAKIRNTSIGTLLVDLSDGMELNKAVARYDQVMAPTNYKRPTAAVTKGMIEKAQKTVEELGLTSALERRYAVIEDITVNNVLFANRDAKAAMNVFDEIKDKIPEKVQNLDKVEEITIDKFLSDVLPKTTSLEALFENRHASNLVSLIAPVDPESKSMFKWDNRFSWSYTGEVADSIKEKVKAAGGSVTGVLRCSLSWHNYDDLDLHMKEPGRGHIYYADKRSQSGGSLDVDMNAGGGRSREPVENIIYPSFAGMKEGTYELYVNQFNAREAEDFGFEVEIETAQGILQFSHSKRMRTGENVPVATIGYTRKDGFVVTGQLTSSTVSRTIWNVPTQTFHKVNVVMLSPNYWDGHGVGNKHFFFMLDKCFNEEKARGFYNEFLKQELDQHRKVFEVVGSKMKTDNSERQLSGLGFSSTQKNSLVVRVGGSFNRTLKVVF